MGGVANDWSMILILCGLTNLFAAIDSINVDILNCLEVVGRYFWPKYL